ncbi:MAG: putative dual-domain glycosyl transferase [Naasia sp.]|nr:putative dual-domain glycosyl transferase [Naasia sp.]
MTIPPNGTPSARPSDDSGPTARRDSSGLAGLAVLVVNYGSSELLAENVAPLSRRAAALRIVVVDNFTSVEERGRVAALAADEGWSTVLLDDNRGFGGGMNAAAQRAFELGATDVLLLNPDAAIEPAAIAALLAAVRAEEDLMVAPRIITPEGRVWFAGSDVYLADGRVRSRARAVPGAKQPWLTGACLLLSRRLWERAGGFDEEYFLYWEDVDFSRRVVNVGGRLAVIDEAVAVHDQGGTQERAGAAKSAVYYYYNVRNRLLYAVRHLDAAGVRRWRRTVLPTAWEVVTRGGRKQLLRHPRGTLLPAVRGVRDGLRASRAAARGGRTRG